MKLLTFALALALPAFALAADYSPVPATDAAPIVEQLLARASGGKTTCCKRCTKGKPCGDSCIAVYKRCTRGPGCAC